MEDIHPSKNNGFLHSRIHIRWFYTKPPIFNTVWLRCLQRYDQSRVLINLVISLITFKYYKNYQVSQSHLGRGPTAGLALKMQRDFMESYWPFCKKMPDQQIAKTFLRKIMSSYAVITVIANGLAPEVLDHLQVHERQRLVPICIRGLHLMGCSICLPALQNSQFNHLSTPSVNVVIHSKQHLKLHPHEQIISFHKC